MKIEINVVLLTNIVHCDAFFDYLKDHLKKFFAFM